MSKKIEGFDATQMYKVIANFSTLAGWIPPLQDQLINALKTLKMPPVIQEAGLTLLGHTCEYTERLPDEKWAAVISAFGNDLSELMAKVRDKQTFQTFVEVQHAVFRVYQTCEGRDEELTIEGLLNGVYQEVATTLMARKANAFIMRESGGSLFEIPKLIHKVTDEAKDFVRDLIEQVKTGEFFDREYWRYGLESDPNGGVRFGTELEESTEGFCLVHGDHNDDKDSGHEDEWPEEVGEYEN